MASVVEVCNMALSAIRAGSINSLDEASLQAQQCSLFFETARDQLLSEHTYGFNHAIKVLAELTEIEVFNWAHVWQYPSDCLHVNRVIRNLADVNPGTGSAVAARLYDHRFRTPADLPAVEYQVFNVSNNKVIATREDEVRIDYRVKITDMNLFTPDARVALAMLLASYIAIPIVGVKDGRQLRVDNLALYTAFKNEAKAQNANQQFIESPPSEFITVRES